MLETLLPELFTLVLPSLELPDLSSLRLTSRQLERRSISAFSTAAFSEVRVDFSASNVRWVRNVANHDEFRLAVRSLRVGKWEGKVTGTSHDPHMSYGLDGHWPRLEDGRVCREAVQPFVDCLLRFSNCASVTVTDDSAVLPYHSDYRGPDRHLSSADAVDLVFHALSTPGAPSIRCFQVRIRRDLDWYPSPYITLPTIAPIDESVMGDLEELSLMLWMEHKVSMEGFLKLLAGAPRLTTLRLMLDYECLTQDGHPWPLISQYLDSLPHLTPLLATLTLVNIRISATSLLRILSSYPDTLRRLDLNKVNLRSGSWDSVLEQLQNFRCLRRYSMFSCREGPALDWVAFCPLWKSCEVRDLPGVRFEFRVWNTIRRTPNKLHVTGALFESSGDVVATRMALRAMVEFSHRCLAEDDTDPSCAKPDDLWKMAEGVDGGYSGLFRRWTGL